MPTWLIPGMRDGAGLAALEFREEVLIQPVHHIGVLHRNAHASGDHEQGESVAINQHNPLVHKTIGVIAGIFAETGRGEKDAFAGAYPTHGAVEGLDQRPPDRLLLVSLGLDVDAGQAQAVFMDAAIDAAIRSALHPLARLGADAIAKGTKKLEHQRLEGLGADRLHPLQQFPAHICFQLADACGDLFLRGDINFGSGLREGGAISCF